MYSSQSRITAPLFAFLICAPISAQVTQRVSVATGGAQGNDSSQSPMVSADGRYVAFHGLATNLVSGDTNGFGDVFVRDRQSGTTERVSVATGGAQANSGAWAPSISADGRFVAFSSSTANLVAGDTNGVQDIFLRDRQSGTTERVSVATGGAQGNDSSGFEISSISADGRFVAFRSWATNLVPGDTNGYSDIFVRDRQSGTTERVSVATGGAQGDNATYLHSISADGRFVAFSSDATNLVAGDTNGFLDVFLRDRQSGTTERVSVATGGAEGNDYSYVPSISADGRYVAFFSRASNLVVGTAFGNIFVRDRQSGTTECASLATGGVQGVVSYVTNSISADGRIVAFISATNFVPGDTNGWADIFVRDRQSGTTERVSVATGGAQGDGESTDPSISADGRIVAFNSYASNFVPGDTNLTQDIFVHDRDATSFTSLCDPGVGGVIACPCSNAPSGLGRGCNNSSSTGGAILSASGAAYLSTDSLVFTTSGERPTALSIVTQWLGSNPTGAVFGMGVRCTSSTFKRLFSKSASAGSITAPDFGAGDPTVSVRSAALGDTLLAGQSRWYFVFYRDPTVLGGCSATSTFNATQTGQVTWSP